MKQTAIEELINKCKKVIDDPNQLETTKGFASIIWDELNQLQAKHEEELKEAVITTYLHDKYCLQSLSETQLLMERAEQYYNENHKPK